jgi:hypothetical protein
MVGWEDSPVFCQIKLPGIGLPGPGSNRDRRIGEASGYGTVRAASCRLAPDFRNIL